MRITRRKPLLLAILVVYLAAVAISVVFLVIKRDSLQFHTRDYPYFIEQAAKLVDPLLTKHYALNIDGNNFLGLQGPEGVKTIYQAIHTEYFRYTYALLYALFRSTIPIYIFYCAIFYLPILYFVFVRRPKTAEAWKQIALFSLMFLLFPGTIPSITFDLRPRMLFMCAWSLMTLAIYYRRPFLEKLPFFVFLLCIREEGILLGAVLIVFDFIRSRQWKQTLVYLALDAAALAAFLAFMDWGGYTRIDVAYNPLNFLDFLLTIPAVIGAAAGGITLLAVAGVWIWRKHRRFFADFLLLLTYILGIGLTAFPAWRSIAYWYSNEILVRPVTAWDVAVQGITDPSNNLLFLFLILLLILGWDYTRGRGRSLYQGFLILICIFFTAATLASVPSQVSGWSSEVAPARLVWDFKGQINRYQTHVLVDYNTYQAFYDCENIVVYNRLPLWMVYPKDRYYPDNMQFLAGLIHEKMEYAVISRESLENVLGLAALSGTPVSELYSNEKYVVLKFNGTPP